MASASQIGKLELSKTGTHLNVVTAADLEGAEDGGPGDTGATPVSIGAALAQVKLAVSLIDDALCLPANPAVPRKDPIGEEWRKHLDEAMPPPGECARGGGQWAGTHGPPRSVPVVGEFKFDPAVLRQHCAGKTDWRR